MGVLLVEEHPLEAGCIARCKPTASLRLFLDPGRRSAPEARTRADGVALCGAQTADARKSSAGGSAVCARSTRARRNKLKNRKPGRSAMPRPRTRPDHPGALTGKRGHPPATRRGVPDGRVPRAAGTCTTPAGVGYLLLVVPGPQPGHTGLLEPWLFWLVCASSYGWLRPVSFPKGSSTPRCIICFLRLPDSVVTPLPEKATGQAPGRLP